MITSLLPSSVSEQPRERLIKHGPRALSTHELLALILGNGTRSSPVLSLATDLLRRFGSLADIARMDVAELRHHHGLGTAKAARLCAALELASRLQSEPFHTRTVITGPGALAAYLAPMFRNARTEHFNIVMLNSANQIIRIQEVSHGSLNACVIHPREVFRLAIAESAAGIILVHNHPSGNTEPSKADIEITKRLVQAGNIVDIRILDHLIIGGDEYTSLVERNLFS